MARRPKDPLRLLTADEHACLTQLSRARSEPASQVARAKALLAVAAGQSYQDAATAAGRRSGDAVARFEGRQPFGVEAGHGGGPPVRYSLAERERMGDLVDYLP